MEAEEVQQITFKGAPMATKGNEVQLTRMPLNKIKLGRNSRANIDKDELEGLMESIKEIGLLQPIGVVKNGTGYDIAYGNRRFLACSKLGHSHIMAIVHTSKKASDVDIKNLAENVQRKNISLVEVGRYVALLQGEGMSTGEIAVRLGASRSYVNSAADAYQQVPKQFRDDIASTYGNEKKKIGKISAQAMSKILSAQKTQRLEAKHVAKLFEAAKGDKFMPAQTGKYAALLKAGKNDFLDRVEPLKMIRMDFLVTEKEYNRIIGKHVDNGPFKSFVSVMRNVLTGKVAEQVKVIEKDR